MRKSQIALVAIVLVASGWFLVAAQQQPPPVPPDLPDWAYGPMPPPVPGAKPNPPAPDDGSLKRIPGSDQAFTMTVVRAIGGVADWHPAEHGPMPDIVKLGKDGARACGFCHLPDGRGNPENAGVWALPVPYFIQQMHDYRDGLRKSSDPRKNNTNMMIGFAKVLTDEEVRAAAEYFAAVTPRVWVKVVESATAPKTRTCCGGMFVALEGAQAGTEPTGSRIVEVPDEFEHTELRDPHAGFTAYVPVGAIKRGAGLSAKFQCALCHGQKLEGIGPVPPLAGRSPSYIARQLFDMKTGARRGLWSELMKPIVANMTNDELVNISAYVASLPPLPLPAQPTASR